MDYGQVETKIAAFIRNYFSSSKKRTAIVGLSGGLDSAATLALCCKALGSKQVLAALLPSASTPARDISDAKSLAKKFKVRTKTISIVPIVRSFEPLSSNRVSRANISARVRMAILYSLAAKYGGLVVGTGDKSEFMLGYFTKYGDGGADLFPIGGLYKTEVRSLAISLGIPASIANKPSSPALWAGHTAEGELGFSYEIADGILREIEKGKKQNELERVFEKKTVSTILARMKANNHKLYPAPVCRL
jgi:NAD+ synthase